MPPACLQASPFRHFNSSPEVIRLVALMYVRFPLSLRNVEDLLFERGIDICHETVRMWWNRFSPLFAGDVRRQRVNRMREFRHGRWHLDEMYVKLNGEMVCLWRAPSIVQQCSHLAIAVAPVLLRQCDDVVGEPQLLIRPARYLAMH
jgi:putative transposase